MSCFRTEHGAEVDLVVELGKQIYALELKASRNAGSSDTRGPKRFAEYYGKPHNSWILYLGSQPKQIGSVRVLPWQTGLREMGL